MGIVVVAIIFYIATGLGSVPHYNIRIYKVYRTVFIGIFFFAPAKHSLCSEFVPYPLALYCIYTSNIVVIIARYWDLL